MKQPRFKVGDKVYVTRYFTNGIVVSIVELDSLIPELYGTLVYKIYIPEWSRIIDGFLEKVLEEPSRESKR